METEFSRALEQRVKNAVLSVMNKEAKMSASEISGAYHAKNPKEYIVIETIKNQADHLVKIKFPYLGNTGNFVFSKDNEENYFWKKANIIDLIRAYWPF